jgi:thiol:disulfide interchange protein
MLKRLYFFIIVTLFTSGLLAAPQITDFSTTALTSSHTTVSAGETIYVSFTITPKNGWHTYWKNPGDSGLNATFKWDLPEGFVAQDTIWPAPSTQSLGSLVNFGYEGSVQLITPIRILDSIPAHTTVRLALRADWLVCEDTCVPESGDYSISITTGLESTYSSFWPSISKTLEDTPGPYSRDYEFKQVDDVLEIHLFSPLKEIDTLYFYPEKSGLISPSSEQALIRNQDTIVLRMPLKRPFSTMTGILDIGYKDGTKQTVELSGKVQTRSWAIVGIMFLFAFIGGLLLNVMPCVLPVLSLKLLQLTSHGGDSKRLIKQQGLGYTLGILVSMWTLACTIFILQASGDAVGWGFHLQSPIVVLGLAFLMFYIGLYLLGVSPLPLFLHSVSGKAAGAGSSKKGSLLGSFLTGTLTVIVATPCTAPFMAPAIGFALTQPPLVTFTIFTSLGLGLALPFLIVAYIPSLITYLPKPGQWMITLQKLLAIPMFATVVWLMWVLNVQIGPSSLFWVLLGCLILIVFSLYSRLKGPPLTKTWIAVLLTLLGIGYSMNIQSVPLTPPLFSTQLIEKNLKNGKPVFVDVTAAWCITCQANKRLVLESDEVKDSFKDNNIEMVVADWTNKNEAITRYLERFGRSGVPLYIYYPVNGDPIILPQILSKEMLLSLNK